MPELTDQQIGEIVTACRGGNCSQVLLLAELADAGHPALDTEEVADWLGEHYFFLWLAVSAGVSHLFGLLRDDDAINLGRTSFVQMLDLLETCRTFNDERFHHSFAELSCEPQSIIDIFAELFLGVKLTPA